MPSGLLAVTLFLSKQYFLWKIYGCSGQKSLNNINKLKIKPSDLILTASNCWIFLSGAGLKIKTGKKSLQNKFVWRPRCHARNIVCWYCFSNELMQWHSTSQRSFILTGRDIAEIEIKPVIAQSKENPPGSLLKWCWGHLTDPSVLFSTSNNAVIFASLTDEKASCISLRKYRSFANLVSHVKIEIKATKTIKSLGLGWSDSESCSHYTHLFCSMKWNQKEGDCLYSAFMTKAGRLTCWIFCIDELPLMFIFVSPYRTHWFSFFNCLCCSLNKP